jgi:ferritin-like protein
MEPLGKELAPHAGADRSRRPAREVPRRRECTIGMTPDAAPDSLGLGASAPAAHSCWMAGASQGWHEREELLTARTKDLHRALVSLQEELEAIDWYQQRVDATEDPELKHILAHNRDEEKEHASMILEWIRRRDVAFARMLKKHTGHSGPIVTEEEEAEASGEADVERRGEKGKR